MTETPGTEPGQTPGRRPAERYPFLDHPGPIPFAHRGGIDYPPNAGIENTVAAFANAIDLGYRYIETDVHATADGKVVVFHDHTLDRVTDASGPIAARTLDELRKVRVGGKEPIPTLEEILATFPDIRFNIDVKVAAVIRPMAEVVEAMKAHDRICVSAFSGRRLRRARRLLPRVASGLEPSGVALRRMPLPRFLTTLLVADTPCIQVPPRWGAFQIVTPTFVDRAHAAGKQVHVWTIDDAAEIHRLLDLGVDGIMTDRPDILRDTLIERGQWVS
ncbi:MAG TPA: glycerophosphodiester phosphodiesterase [Actinopolymorphaceae bacterium]